jgi:nucleoside-diphosphate-sugar epimerase
MKILITGGSGFIGTNILSFLLDNEITNILNLDISEPVDRDHKSFWKKIDINSYNDLLCEVNRFQPTCIINLAADTGVDLKSLDDFNTNINGVKNILQVSQLTDSIQHVLFFSTLLVCKIGYYPKHDQDYNPSTPYGESKVIGETIIRNFQSPNFTWTMLRPISIWGPWCNEPYKNFFKSVMNGWYFHIGDGHYRRSLGFVGNLVQQVHGLLLSNFKQINGKTYYLADENPVDIRFMAETIKAETNPGNIICVPFIVAKCLAKLGDFLQLLGWRFVPLTTFRLNNITTEYIYDLRPIHKVTTIKPIELQKAIKLTLSNFQK